MAKKRKPKYYTPKHIADYAKGNIVEPSAGSGAFLKQAADMLTQWLLKNPPFGKSK